MTSFVTAVILTLNEADDLPACLAAIPKALPVLVLDSGSTDETLDIARAAGATVRDRRWTGFADQRNFALRSCGVETPWVLFVDADERYPPSFFDWMAKILPQDPPVDVFEVPSRLFLDGGALWFAPGYPVLHPRLVRRAAVSFTPNHAGHGETVASARTARSPIAYDHYFQAGDLYPWLQKHLRLAEADARAHAAPTSRRGRLAAQLGRGPMRALARFVYHYVLRGGFLDGGPGLRYALMYTWYELTAHLIWRSRGGRR